MSEGIGERIAQLRQRLRMTRPEFAIELSVKPTLIRDVERLKQRVPADLVAKIQDRFRPAELWLLTGSGDMFPLPGDSRSTPSPQLSERNAEEWLGALKRELRRESDEHSINFGARMRLAAQMLSEVLDGSELKPRPLLMEALKSVAYLVNQPEVLALLVAGIEEQIKQAAAKGDGTQ